MPGALADRLLHLLGIAAEQRRQQLARRCHRPIPTAATGSLDATATLLRALALEGPLLVVLDDLQWASEELLEAIGEVAKRLRGPILLVLIGREPADDRRRSRRPARSTLGPLDETTAHRLLRAYLGGGELADPLAIGTCSAAPRATRTSSPSCCICWSTAVCCCARATPGSRPGRCRPTRSRPRCSRCSPPASTGSMPTAKSVLRAASVLGLRFAAEALRVVDQRPAEEVQAALDELTARQLLRPPSKGEIWWTFTHPMARDVAYGSLPKADRARRHARAAQWAAERGARVGSTQQSTRSSALRPSRRCSWPSPWACRPTIRYARCASSVTQRWCASGRWPARAMSTAAPPSCWPAPPGWAKPISPRSW